MITVHGALFFSVTQVKVKLCIIYMYLERKWQINRQVVRNQEGRVRQLYLSIWACTGGYPPFNWVEKRIIWWHHTEKEATRYQFTHPTLSVYSSISLSIHPSIHLSIHPLKCLSVPLSIHPPPIGSLHLSIFTCLYLSDWLTGKFYCL